MIRPHVRTRREFHRRDVRLRLLVVLGVLMAMEAGRQVAYSSERPPNYVVIFCDDLGYGDLGCFGATKIRTPHIDALAETGMKFTSFYVAAPVCTPSRASLMTGCYPGRVEMDLGVRFPLVLHPVSPKGLNPTEITIADLLKPHGYATACIGKWHLGDQLVFLPTRQGFNYFFGLPYSNDCGTRLGKDWPPLPLMCDERVIEAPAVQDTLTMRYTKEAIGFIRRHRESPFFLYLAHTFPHDPLHASPQFRGKSANGIYGDAVEEIDWSTGEIVKELQRLRLLERTLIVFTSDNGAAPNYGGSNLPLRGHKATVWEGGMRVPCVMCWPGTIPAGRVCGEIVSAMDLLPTFAHLASVQVPADRIIDGKDILALMLDQPGAVSPHESFFYYIMDKLKAVRAGKWKLHLEQQRTPGDVESNAHSAPAKLFNLEEDLAETKDCSKDHPEVVARLTALAEKARADLGDGTTAGLNQRSAGYVEIPTPRVLDHTNAK